MLAALPEIEAQLKPQQERHRQAQRIMNEKAEERWDKERQQERRQGDRATGRQEALAFLEVEAPLDPVETVIDAIGAERGVGVVGHLSGGGVTHDDFQGGQTAAMIALGFDHLIKLRIETTEINQH